MRGKRYECSLAFVSSPNVIGSRRKVTTIHAYSYLKMTTYPGVQSQSIPLDPWMFVISGLYCTHI